MNFLKQWPIIILVIAWGVFAVGEEVKAANDLELVSLATSPASPVFNMDTDINVTIKNNGDDPLGDYFNIYDYSYNFENFSVYTISEPNVSDTSPIAPGESISYTFRGRFEKIEEATLFFRINDNSSLSERTYVNNDSRVKINVISPYNLTVGDITMDITHPTEAMPLTISVSIVNNGHIDLVNSFGISAYSVDFQDFEIEKTVKPSISSYEPLVPGGSVVYEFSGKFSNDGDKELAFSVDTDDVLDETDENNILTKTVYIASPREADITVEAINVDPSPERIISGEDVTIVIDIKNTGKTSLTGRNGFVEYWYDLSDFKIDKQSQSEYPSFEKPMNPGDIYQYEFTGQFTNSGEKEIKFEVNKSRNLSEINYNNNVNSQTASVFSSLDAADEFRIIDHNYSFTDSQSVEIRWTTDRDSDGEVRYREGGYSIFQIYMVYPRIDEWPQSKKNVSEHLITLSGLVPGKRYIYQIFGTKNSVEKKSEEINIVMPINDTLLFSSNIRIITGATSTQKRVAWDTNLQSSGYVYFKLNGSEAYSKAGSAAFSSKHEVLLENLVLGEYNYYVESASLAGSVASSSVKQFTISAEAVRVEANDEDKAESEGSEDAAAVSEVSSEAKSFVLKNLEMYQRLRGKIMLKVEDSGKAYYIHPEKETMHYLGRPADAFQVMREQGVGITNVNLEKVSLGLGNLTGPDSDGDGLPDIFEDAIGTDKNSKDSDGDGFEDRAELDGGYNPRSSGGAGLGYDQSFSGKQHGKIFIQVEGNGEAWYINPADSKRYFLGRPADAFQVMRNLSLGISNVDFDRL